MIAVVSEMMMEGDRLLEDAVADRLRLDHIGVAVRSIDAARGIYEALGLTVSDVETVEQEQVRTAMLALGKSRIELIEPLIENSVVGRFLAKRGEGLHHIAIHADDIEMRFKRLQEQGVRLVGNSIGTGAGGHRYFFVHPASTGGVLIEIVGDAFIVGVTDAPCMDGAKTDALKSDAVKMDKPRMDDNGAEL